MKFTALLISAISALAVRASDPTIEDVVVPPITYPTANLNFTYGDTFNVTWDTSSLPPPSNITNHWSSISLRTESYTLPLVLAGNVNVTQGYATVTIPWLRSGIYQFVLYGDSGNFSPEFNITSPNPNVAPIIK